MCAHVGVFYEGLYGVARSIMLVLRENETFITMLLVFAWDRWEE